MHQQSENRDAPPSYSAATESRHQSQNKSSSQSQQTSSDITSNQFCEPVNIIHSNQNGQSVNITTNQNGQSVIIASDRNGKSVNITTNENGESVITTSNKNGQSVEIISKIKIKGSSVIVNEEVVEHGVNPIRMVCKNCHCEIVTVVSKSTGSSCERARCLCCMLGIGLAVLSESMWWLLLSCFSTVDPADYTTYYHSCPLCEEMLESYIRKRVQV